jgi:hypothetical protein
MGFEITVVGLCNALREDCLPATICVRGDADPVCFGTFLPTGNYNENIYYTLDNWYLYYDLANHRWCIAESLGGACFWYSDPPVIDDSKAADGILGSYTPGDGTGNPILEDAAGELCPPHIICVSGETEPICFGTFTHAGEHNNKPYYALDVPPIFTSNSWYLYYNVSNEWYISDALGAGYSYWFSADLLGNYSAGIGVGNPILADSNGDPCPLITPICAWGEETA